MLIKPTFSKKKRVVPSIEVKYTFKKWSYGGDIVDVCYHYNVPIDVLKLLTYENRKKVVNSDFNIMDGIEINSRKIEDYYLECGVGGTLVPFIDYLQNLPFRR